MSEPRILQEMQAEIERLKIEIATPRDSPIQTRAAIKDVTLVAGIKVWTGDSKSRSVHEFFSQTRMQKLAIGQRMRKL
jgi:hypothetical protein